MEAAQLLEGLGRITRARRQAAGLTLKDLAQRSGLSPRFLLQVESGQGNISVARLLRLADALGTTPGALLPAPAAVQPPPVIALLGLRGAGKTTLGRRLARRLHRPFVELDRRVEQASELSLGEIFAVHGEDYYRRLERECLEAILAEEQPLVLATGGGLVNAPDSYALLRQRALTVWLRADPEDHWNRVLQQGDRRPMADHPEAMGELRRLLATREPLYSRAEITLDTSGRSVDELVDRLVAGVTRDDGAARPPTGV